MSTDPKQIAARVPKLYRASYLRALRGKVPKGLAIKLKCLECCAWERHEGGRDKIGGCQVLTCPLWHLRPFQAKQAKDESQHV